jgi:hypothetical protein
MTEPPTDDVLHRLKNHIAVIVGYCDLLVAEFAEDDPHRADLLEVHKAGREAMALLPDVARRIQNGSLS